LFTRHLLRFRLINHFKPLLDAFQGSYKDKHYYWVAVNIILRGLFFALCGFKSNLQLIIATMILIIFTTYHGYTNPNKNKFTNIQELLLLINLAIMYAMSYQGSTKIFSSATNVMISFAFIQFSIIILYHFLTYACKYNVMIVLHKVKENVTKFCNSKSDHHLNDIALLNIPEGTYNYSEYQDQLISNDYT